jgi:hypothetical protein
MGLSGGLGAEDATPTDTGGVTFIVDTSSVKGSKKTRKPRKVTKRENCLVLLGGENDHGRVGELGQGASFRAGWGGGGHAGDADRERERERVREREEIELSG